jgi:hypothetical protein
MRNKRVKENLPQAGSEADQRSGRGQAITLDADFQVRCWLSATPRYVSVPSQVFSPSANPAS